MEAETTTGLASQAGHWYRADGSPCYEIRARNGAMRPVTLRDARKLDLYPSVTTVQGCAAKPGLEAWKVRQAILAALTLPRLVNELDEEYIARVLLDSREQARKAAELGTRIHAEIEGMISEGNCALEYAAYVVPVYAWLIETYPGTEWRTERSFACDLGYGGKVDLYARAPPVVIDFKTKDFGSTDLVVAYPDQGVQLAAYAYGLGLEGDTVQRWNVFVSTREPGLVVPWQWPVTSYARHMDMFKHLLGYWKADKQYAPLRIVAA